MCAVKGLVTIEFVVIQEDIDYNIKKLKTNLATVTTNFNADQKKICTTIIKENDCY